MVDKVTNSKNKDWLPIDMEARVEFCAGYLLSTTVSDPGFLWCLNVGIAKGLYDRSYTLDAGFEQVRRDSGSFPGGGEGTTSPTIDNFFNLKVGRNDKKVVPGTGGRAKDGAWVSISESIIGGGLQDLGGGSRSPGESGESFELSSDSRKLLYFGSTLGKGYQHYFKDSRIYIEPSALFEQGTFYPLVSAEELGEYFSSAQNLAIRFSLKIGYGDMNDEPGQNKPWDAYDDTYTYYSDLNGFIQRVLRYKLYDGPAQGEKRVYEDLGTSGDLPEDVAPLMMALSLSKSEAITNFSQDCFEASRGDSNNCYIRMGVRGVVGIATAFAGDAMLQDSLGDLAMVASAGLSISPIDSSYQLLIEELAGAGIFFTGALLGNANVSMSGYNWLQSSALSPDRRGLKKGMLRSEIILKPYSYNFLGPVEGSGSTSVERRVYYKKDEGFYTTWEAESHVIAPQNIGPRFENAAGGDDPYDLTMPTRGRAGAGYEKLFGGLSLSVDGHVYQDFSGDVGTGVGASANIAYEIETGLDSLKKVDLGVGIMIEQGLGSDPAGDLRLQMPVYLGVSL